MNDLQIWMRWEESEVKKVLSKEFTFKNVKDTAQRYCAGKEGKEVDIHSDIGPTPLLSNEDLELALALTLSREGDSKSRGAKKKLELMVCTVKPEQPAIEIEEVKPERQPIQVAEGQEKGSGEWLPGQQIRERNQAEVMQLGSKMHLDSEIGQGQESRLGSILNDIDSLTQQQQNLIIEHIFERSLPIQAPSYSSQNSRQDSALDSVRHPLGPSQYRCCQCNKPIVEFPAFVCLFCTKLIFCSRCDQTPREKHPSCQGHPMTRTDSAAWIQRVLDRFDSSVSVPIPANQLARSRAQPLPQTRFVDKFSAGEVPSGNLIAKEVARRKEKGKREVAFTSDQKERQQQKPLKQIEKSSKQRRLKHRFPGQKPEFYEYYFRGEFEFKTWADLEPFLPKEQKQAE